MAQTGSVQRIDTSAFDTAIGEIESAKSAFDQAKETFENASKSALEGWSGYGRDAFKKTYTQLSRALRDEKDNLIAFGKELKAIKESYEKWDLGTAKNIKKETASTSKSKTNTSSGGNSAGGR